MKFTSFFLLLITLYLGVQLFLKNKDNNELRTQLILQIDFNQDQLLRSTRDCEVKLNNLREYMQFVGVENQVIEAPSLISSSDSSNRDNDFFREKSQQLSRSVDLKYAILLQELHLPYDVKERLLSLLVEREEILSAGGFPTANQEEIETLIKNQKQSLIDVDLSIQALLNENQKLVYDLLKDSAYEQFQLNGFLDGIDTNSLLTQEDRRFLVLEKLKSRHLFFENLEDLSKEIHLSQGDFRLRLIEQAREVLHTYKDTYLVSAKNILTDEQFSALREMEQNSANEMWDSLLAGWGVETLSN